MLVITSTKAIIPINDIVRSQTISDNSASMLNILLFTIVVLIQLKFL